jgi:hypothetical protein
VIHDAKCSAVSLGKEASTGDNYAALRGDKPGYQYQLEPVFAARQAGWDREHVGSHVVRRNTIYDCGQNAIAGNLGCAFSTIEDNHKEPGREYPAGPIATLSPGESRIRVW